MFAEFYSDLLRFMVKMIQWVRDDFLIPEETLMCTQMIYNPKQTSTKLKKKANTLNTFLFKSLLCYMTFITYATLW